MKEKLIHWKNVLKEIKENQTPLFISITALLLYFIIFIITLLYFLFINLIPIKYLLIFIILSLAVGALSGILILFVYKAQSKDDKKEPENIAEEDAQAAEDIIDEDRHKEEKLNEEQNAAEESAAAEISGEPETVISASSIIAEAEEDAYKSESEEISGDGTVAVSIATEQKIKKPLILSVTSIVLTVLMIFFNCTAFIQVFKVKRTLNAMMDTTYNSTIVVYTLSDTIKTKSKSKTSDVFNIKYYVDEAYKNFKTTLNYNDSPVMGINTFVAADDREAALEEIYSKFDTEFTFENYYSFPDLASALLEGEVDYIIMNEALTTLITDEYPDFLEQVSVVDGEIIKKEMSEIDPNPIITEPFTIFICGLDNFGKLQDEGGGDVNILIFVDPVDKEVLLVSTPRDMYVSVDHNPRVKDKLTNVARYKSFDGLIGSLEDLYDTKIDYYIKLNFTSFINIVDSIGGITITPTESFKITGATTGTVVRLQPGIDVHLSGETALSYVRERKQLTRGDRSRAENGLAVLMAMFSKFTGDYCESGIYDYYDILMENIKTNMSPEDAKALLDMQITDRAIWSFSSMVMDGSDLYTTTLTSHGSVVYVMVPDEDLLDEIKEIIKDVRD